MLRKRKKRTVEEEEAEDDFVFPTGAGLLSMDDMSKSTLRRVSVISSSATPGSPPGSTGQADLASIRRNSIRRISTTLVKKGYTPSLSSISRPLSVSSLGKPSPLKIRDLVLMEEISQEEILEVLQQRYMEDIIYTYIGNVVVSVNPYKQLRIYDSATIDKYRGAKVFDLNLPPHIYALTDSAYSDMCFRVRSQVVVISGESGAGKTEASKQIMQYIAAVSGGGKDGDMIKTKLLKTNPVLEAFGNAKTIRNDNSSRFGKFMNINFDYHGHPIGGTITTYLLEKARVTRQAEGERNFHVFYQLCAAGELKKYGLRDDPKQYTYLNQGGVEQVKGTNSKADWMEVMSSLTFLGFSKELVVEIVKILGGVLMLGQLDVSNLEKCSELQTAGKLLSTSGDALRAAISNNTIVAQGQMVTSPLDEEQTSYARHTLSKALYDRLFKWLAGKMNERIRTELEDTLCIGVLDIYGFEIFNENSFEQFCINYCNEKLQQLFIDVTLKTEQSEYEAEGIDWVSIPYFDNKAICDLIEKRPNGVLAMLDEECVRPGDRSDAIFLLKLDDALRKNDFYGSRMTTGLKTIPDDVFVITHYAGEVEYRIHGFLDKNVDTLFRDLSRGMFEGGSDLLRELFPEGDVATWTTAMRRPKTAGAAFKSSMANMIDLLTEMSPSYIRCIKPNDKKRPGQFDDLAIKHQICYLGLVENIRVRRAGFCFRMEKKAFFMRFRAITKETYPNWSGSLEDGIKKIVSKCSEDSQLAFGKTKVFIKDPKVVFAVESARDEKSVVVATQIQRFWRRCHVRRVVDPYWQEVSSRFAQVSKDPSFGKNTAWPADVPKKVKQADTLLKRIQRSWWARRKVLTLSTADQKHMRLLILAQQCMANQFSGASSSPDSPDGIAAAAVGTSVLRKAFDLNRRFHGIYAADEAAATSRAQRAAAVCKDKEVKFVAPLLKLNRSGKLDQRNIVLSESHFLKVDGGFKANVKRAVAFTSLRDVTISPHSDSVLVLHSKEVGQDTVGSLEFNGENLVPEFVARLQQAYKEQCGQPLPIVVNQDPAIEYNNSGKAGQAKALTFIPGQEDGKTSAPTSNPACTLTSNSVTYNVASK